MITAQVFKGLPVEVCSEGNKCAVNRKICCVVSDKAEAVSGQNIAVKKSIVC